MDLVLNRLNTLVVDPLVLRVPSSPLSSADWSYVDPSYSISRQIIVTWAFLTIVSYIVYFLFCGTTYWIYFLPKNNNKAMWKYDGEQLANEIWTSIWSGFFMSGMTAPIEVAVVYGHGRVYDHVSDYGVAYLIFSLLLFIVFTDTLIYWIHRALHWPSLYAIHKLHHRYQDTTPFSAFSFHPLDGWAQGLPYHLFVFVFPMHKYLYLGVLFMVGLWTMNIHDRFTFDWYGVNGAAHHTIHHTKFLYNYGQYFTFWDRFYGTFMDPFTKPPYNNPSEYRTKLWGLKAAALASASASTSTSASDDASAADSSKLATPLTDAGNGPQNTTQFSFARKRL